MADQGSEGLLSPFLRSQRLRAAKNYLKGRVLDVGCGSGGLADLIPSDCYLGVERDEISLNRAKSHFPGHMFFPDLPDDSEKFDTIVLLAVIEHIKNPAIFLNRLVKYLREDNSSRIILSTPHPFSDWIHDAGIKLGLFSKHANDEHEALLDRAKLDSIGNEAGLHLIFYKRFLLGVNQLAIFKK